MLSVLWPIRHPEVQPGGGDRVVVGSAVRNCSPGLQTIQKVDDVTYGKWKTLSQITHTLRQPKRRPTKKGNQFIGHVISNQLRRPLVFGLPSDDVYQYLGGLLLRRTKLLNQKLSTHVLEKIKLDKSTLTFLFTSILPPFIFLNLFHIFV